MNLEADKSQFTQVPGAVGSITKFPGSQVEQEISEAQILQLEEQDLHSFGDTELSIHFDDPAGQRQSLLEGVNEG